MNALQILIAARKLIEDRGKWVNHAPTEDDCAYGRNCAATALWRTRGSADDRELIRAGDQAYKALAAAMRTDTVTEFNDSHTHAEVLAAYDRAIEAMRGQP